MNLIGPVYWVSQWACRRELHGVYVRRATRDGGRGMHVRVVTFTGAKDIDAGIKFLEETVNPVLNSQKGYRGFTAKC